MAFFTERRKCYARKSKNQRTLLPKRDIQYVVAIAIISAIFVIFGYLFMNGSSEMHAQTNAFSILAMIQVFFFIDIWLSHRHILSHLHMLKSKVFLITFFFPLAAQLLIVRVPFLIEVFHVTKLSYTEFLVNVGISILILIPIRIVKGLVYR
jgi:magnesium-transporting ATPase (P-type)